MTVLSSALETSRLDNEPPCAESLLAEFALLWLSTSRHKGVWEEADWDFEELCNRVLLFGTGWTPKASGGFAFLAGTQASACDIAAVPGKPTFGLPTLDKGTPAPCSK